jgi:uncharacterized membrane protein YcaP (DUF421 family)
MFNHQSVNKFVQGEPLMLIYEGKVKKKALEQSELSLEELEAAVREHGVSDIEKVNLAILEVDGNISVIADDYTHRTTRKHKSHKILRSQG